MQGCARAATSGCHGRRGNGDPWGCQVPSPEGYRVQNAKPVAQEPVLVCRRHGSTSLPYPSCIPLFRNDTALLTQPLTCLFSNMRSTICVM